MVKEKVVEVKVLILVDNHSGFTKLLSEHGFSTLITTRYESGKELNVL
ncbi:MAG: hypothetical protein QXV93_02540 [Zestosphaera sp.]